MILLCYVKKKIKNKNEEKARKKTQSHLSPRFSIPDPIFQETAKPI